MEINEKKYGFILKSCKRIEDIDANLIEYYHEKSGATVAYIENEDTNCCFAIGFRTIPTDSTGVCHIIEHSVLCGSQKYPLKEPFVNLLKGSMATFLNAFTGSDWTMYPFASQTPKDFDNILSVYLDAVFHPLSVIDPKPFLQEGWHVELNAKEDMPSYKGVVYNEMKGAMSSVDRVLVQATNEAMYKDTFYSYNSGGEPSAIPTLTYEAYKAFYHKHYTPQNALTFFYGKLDIEAKLKYLDEAYFSNYEKTSDEILIPIQQPLVDTSYEVEYELGKEETIKDNTYMSLCFELDHFKNKEELIAWQVLSAALLSSNNSPLKKKLLDAKLGQDIEYMVNDSNIMPALYILLNKTNYSKKEEFLKAFLTSIQELLQEGLDKKNLLATINNHEFNAKEMDTGGFPKGLVMAMNMMNDFNYYLPLHTHLEFSDVYNKLKQELDHGYFENLLKKYILNSKHYVEVVAKPSKTLGEQKRADMEAKMKALKEKMSEKEIEDLLTQSKELLAYQNHVDTPKELATLPKLSIKDIPTTVNYLPSKKVNIHGISGITHTLVTNHISYVNFYFDLQVLPYEDLPYCMILENLLGDVATKNYDAMSLQTEINTYLGKLYFDKIITSATQDSCVSKFKVTSSALKENVCKIPYLVEEILLRSKFSTKDVNRALKQIEMNLKNFLIGNGHVASMNMISALNSKEGNIALNAQASVVTYQFIAALNKKGDIKAVVTKLKEICKVLFTKKNCFISLSGDEATLSDTKEALKAFKLPRKTVEYVLKPKVYTHHKEALVIPSEVSYNGLGTNLSKLNQEYNGKLLVLSHIIRYDYLWNEVRVKGGAYGVSLRFQASGNILLGSYRDPNVTNTYTAYENIVNYLKSFHISKQLFNSYLIGATGTFDEPLSAGSFVNSADRLYLLGMDKKYKINLKKQMLHTKMEDISAYASLFEALNETHDEYSIGNEDKLKKYGFDKVNSL